MFMQNIMPQNSFRHGFAVPPPSKREAFVWAKFFALFIDLPRLLTGRSRAMPLRPSYQVSAKNFPIYSIMCFGRGIFMKKLAIYIHGQGGNPQEAQHYSSLLPGVAVLGLDYSAQNPWQAKQEFPLLWERMVPSGTSPIA